MGVPTQGLLCDDKDEEGPPADAGRPLGRPCRPHFPYGRSSGRGGRGLSPGGDGGRQRVTGLPSCRAIARCIALRARGVSRASW